MGLKWVKQSLSSYLGLQIHFIPDFEGVILWTKKL